jgi:hypothetical protein
LGHHDVLEYSGWDLRLFEGFDGGLGCRQSSAKTTDLCINGQWRWSGAFGFRLRY